MAVAALSAVLGHVFPVWLRFKGGKGVATALGVFCVLFPKALLVALAIFILVVAVTRYVSLGSILGAIAFPVAAYFIQNADWLSLVLASGVSLIIVLKHHQTSGGCSPELRIASAETSLRSRRNSFEPDSRYRRGRMGYGAGHGVGPSWRP